MVQEKDFYYKKNRMAQLRSVCAVFQSNYSVTEAAEKTHIARSALSKQLSSLERDLGTKLFIRTKQKTLEPTQEGILFYKDAIQYVNGIDGLFENFNEKVKDYNNSHLNIALHQMVATYIFPSILEKMLKMEEFKNIKINIFNSPKINGINQLLKKEVDLAFYINTPKETFPVEIERIKSLESHVCLVFNKSHMLNKKKFIIKEDLDDCTFLRRNIKTDTYNSVYSHFNSNVSNIGTIGVSFETILEIIKITDNVSTVPELFLKNTSYDLSSISYRNIDHLIDKSFFEVMVLKKISKTRPVEWLINEFKNLKDN